MITRFASIETLFYLAALIAIIASLKVVTQKNTVHALLYLVVSLLAVAVCFYLMGAPFAAGLEVIVYAGAILVLFVFAIMMFGLKNDETKYAPQSTGLTIWLGPCLLAVFLLLALLLSFDSADIQQQLNATVISSKDVGILLYGPYLLAVEIASFLLLAGLVAGYHYAKPDAQGGHL
ncbi:MULTISPECIES: NADH-quinone oxidoreductase subunit J [Thalassotalea]|uniref:NADH-quinone oxidoreductase subunit J n=1 Tax=Thalassotalea castellviae TaxID=3075612 RepID=A0ABU2ZYF9_9GAMM|nr:NADH-quinone oxidoreductase subunit J [Thalassotalea sp. W431]MDT0602730.1 NADH-quinone oxidoreductase subunit J [Thalassotalea sp. W431]